jgi:hypothetical protein
LPQYKKWRTEVNIPDEDEIYPDQSDQFSHIPEVFKNT